LKLVLRQVAPRAVSGRDRPELMGGGDHMVLKVEQAAPMMVRIVKNG
jgi:hypothetical protein